MQKNLSRGKYTKISAAIIWLAIASLVFSTAAFALDPTDGSDAKEDTDKDGLKNVDEFNYGTDPNNPDSDADKVTDGWEVHFRNVWYEKQLSEKSKSLFNKKYDELNSEEQNLVKSKISEEWPTRPLNPIDGTDAGAVADEKISAAQQAVANGQAPTVLYQWADADAQQFVNDPDNDGWNNFHEYLAGTDPTNPNTDGDSFTKDSQDPNPLIPDDYESHQPGGTTGGQSDSQFQGPGMGGSGGQGQGQGEGQSQGQGEGQGQGNGQGQGQGQGNGQGQGQGSGQGNGNGQNGQGQGQGQGEGQGQGSGQGSGQGQGQGEGQGQGQGQGTGQGQQQGNGQGQQGQGQGQGQQQGQGNGNGQGNQQGGQQGGGQQNQGQGNGQGQSQGQGEGQQQGQGQNGNGDQGQGQGQGQNQNGGQGNQQGNQGQNGNENLLPTRIVIDWSEAGFNSPNKAITKGQPFTIKGHVEYRDPNTGMWNLIAGVMDVEAYVKLDGQDYKIGNARADKDANWNDGVGYFILSATIPADAPAGEGVLSVKAIANNIYAGSEISEAPPAGAAKKLNKEEIKKITKKPISAKTVKPKKLSR